VKPRAGTIVGSHRDGEGWTIHRNVNELKMVEFQARRTMMARADATPQLSGADKSDWFGLRRGMLLRMAAVETMMPNLRASVAGTLTPSAHRGRRRIAPTLQACHFELISRKGIS
jgi:hypothetical protein